MRNTPKWNTIRSNGVFFIKEALHGIRFGQPRIDRCQLNYYLHAMVAKGEPYFHRHSPQMQATPNPYAPFEILSETMEERNRFDKWRCYR